MRSDRQPAGLDRMGGKKSGRLIDFADQNPAFTAIRQRYYNTATNLRLDINNSLAWVAGRHDDCIAG